MIRFYKIACVNRTRVLNDPELRLCSVTRFDETLPHCQNLKVLATFEGFVLHSAKFGAYFGKQHILLGKFLWLQMAQNSKCFWHLITLSSSQKIRILNLKKKFGRTQLRPIYCHSFFCHAIVLKQFEARRRATRRGRTVQPDWVIFYTLGNHSKLVATIILPKLPTL